MLIRKAAENSLAMFLHAGWLRVSTVNKGNDAVTALEMQSIEMNAEYLGVSQIQLMENAGNAVSFAIVSRFSADSRVAIYSGPGKNGGDGMVVARILSSQGYNVTFYLVGREMDLHDETVILNWAALKNMTSSVNLEVSSDSSIVRVADADVVVDALLGIGARGAPRPPILQAIQAINQSSGFKVAVDIPTGVDSDTGQAPDAAVKANLTITFHRPKTGLLKAKRYVGELVVASVGIPPEAELFVGPGDVARVTKDRPAESHKGDFGKVLVIGGNEIYSGAPAYVALAALRTGVDLVHVAAPGRAANIVASFSPNMITMKLKGTHFREQHLEQIEPVLKKMTAVAVGPGLGLHEETFRAIDGLFILLEKHRKPTLIDADALKAIGRNRRRIEFPTVLTPHLGEFETITGEQSPTTLDSRKEKACQIAKELNTTILLKGHVDVISDGARIKLNRTGNPGMTVGGTGDVLSGIAAAFLSQGFDPFDAACGAAFVNGASGDFVLQEKGPHMVATDLIEYIPRIISNPISHKEIQDRLTRMKRL